MLATLVLTPDGDVIYGKKELVSPPKLAIVPQ
jgi:hypothetical protein